MDDVLRRLREPMPHDLVHWRCQTLTKAGDKGLALAYIDARGLMDRLDEVVGPENWADEYTETARGRVICTLSLRIGGEWIAKSDGAGDSDVEGEKGGISDAFKRAGVKWGVARELYGLGNVWVPCKTWERQGKKVWDSWTVDPWSCVRGQKQPQSPKPNNQAKRPQEGNPADPDPGKSIAQEKHAKRCVEAARQLRGMANMEELHAGWATIFRTEPDIAADPDVIKAKDERKAELAAAKEAAE